MTAAFRITSMALASFGLMVASSQANAGPISPAALDVASGGIAIVEPAARVVRRGVGVRRGVVVARPVARGPARRAVRRAVR
jgi:hypothetical protein